MLTCLHHNKEVFQIWRGAISGLIKVILQYFYFYFDEGEEEEEEEIEDESNEEIDEDTDDIDTASNGIDSINEEDMFWNFLVSTFSWDDLHDDEVLLGTIRIFLLYIFALTVYIYI